MVNDCFTLRATDQTTEAKTLRWTQQYVNTLTASYVTTCDPLLVLGETTLKSHTTWYGKEQVVTQRGSQRPFHLNVFGNL